MNNRYSRIVVMSAITVFHTTLILPALAGRPPFFRPPDYDSQWVALAPGVPQVLTHNLGGDAGDYVVNLTLQPPGAQASWDKATNRGAGGDTWFDGIENKIQGVAWSNLTDSEVTLIRFQDDMIAPAARIRIWKITAPDYDSGWFNIAPDADQTLTHNLGGDPDKYVVDLRFADADINSTIGYHNIAENGDSAQGGFIGGYWLGLDGSQIKARRMPQDALCGRMRVRIWKDVEPARTEGWEPWNADPSRTYPINMVSRGPWTDYVVIMDTRLPQVDNKPRSLNIGGDTAQGYYFDSMEHGGMNVSWGTSEGPSTDFRVRLITYSAPLFDSDWRSVSPGGGDVMTHGIGGNPDDYWVDLQFRNPAAQLGVNAAQLGGDQFDDASGGTQHGGTWQNLTAQEVKFLRFLDDLQVSEYRLRIWMAAPPDYDSGFMAINPGQTLSVMPNLLAGSASWVIEVRQRDTDQGFGDQAFWYGGDNYKEMGGADKLHGVAISEISGTLPNETVKVTRFPDDLLTDEVRVRVWVANNEDYERFFRPFSPGEVYTINHDLGRNPDNYVVAMRFRSGSGGSAIQHHLGWGGDRVFDTSQNLEATGGAWGKLTSSLITFWREKDDVAASDIGVKIWSLGYPGAKEAGEHIIGRHELPPMGDWRQQADYTGDATLNVADLIMAIHAGYE